MAKGAYFFPFYYQRFLASCTGWDDDEVGCYLKLLIYQFDKGSIPNDMKILSKISNSVKKNWPLIQDKFIVLPDGNMINEVMDEIRSKHLNKKEKNTENGNKGGRPKLIKNITEEEPNGYELNNRMDIHTNMVNGLLVNGSSETVTNTQSLRVPDQTDFLHNKSWKESFCMTKGITMPDLENIQQRFVDDVNLKGEFVDNWKRYFTNWYNKTLPKAERVATKKMVM